MQVLSDEVREFLVEPRFGVMATINRDGTAQQSVIWYDLRGDRIMMNTKVGRLKERNLKRDPRISLCVEDEFRYVTVKGTITLDYDHERSQEDIKNLAIRYYQDERAEKRVRDQFSKEARVTIYLTVEKVDVHF